MTLIVTFGEELPSEELAQLQADAENKGKALQAVAGPFSENPRAFTKEEARDHLIRHLDSLVSYWANARPYSIPGHPPAQPYTVEYRIDGALFSALTMLDGMTVGLPAVNLSLAPHPEDKDYRRERNANWYEPGMVINDDVYLHDLWVQRRADKS